MNTHDHTTRHDHLSQPDLQLVDELGLPDLDGGGWDAVLDAIYGQAARQWEHGHTDVADALAQLADALAAHPPVAIRRGEV